MMTVVTCRSLTQFCVAFRWGLTPSAWEVALAFSHAYHTMVSVGRRRGTVGSSLFEGSSRASLGREDFCWFGGFRRLTRGEVGANPHNRSFLVILGNLW
jgi:hypothetical protein